MILDLVNLVFSLLTGLLSILPASFVKDYIDNMDALEYLSYINFFIPFYALVQIGQAWLVCCGLYLVYHYVKSVYENTSRKV